MWSLKSSVGLVVGPETGTCSGPSCNRSTQSQQLRPSQWTSRPEGLRKAQDGALGGRSRLLLVSYKTANWRILPAERRTPQLSSFATFRCVCSRHIVSFFPLFHASSIVPFVFRVGMAFLHFPRFPRQSLLPLAGLPTLSHQQVN